MEQCGRTTKSGKPCKANRPSRFHVACKLHADAAEQERGDAVHAAYWAGWRKGCEDGCKSAQGTVERLEARIAALQATTRRMTDHDGAQIVQVGKYSYRWTGEPLAVGDEVWLPENYVSKARIGPGPWRAAVTALGTDYTGALAPVLRRAEPRAGVT